MNSCRRLPLSLFCVLLCVHLWAADPAPEFTAAGVVRSTGTAKILVPGVHMSIYGQHLAPAGRSCSGSADPQRRETPNLRRPDQRFVDTAIYPAELCGVQVLIGDKPGGLLFVSEKQINFKLPQDSPESGSVELRVVRMGESSAPVTMEAGFEKTTISLEEPAYVGMPVWLKVDLPVESGTIRYPYVLGPAGFGCNEFEVRRGGRALTVEPGANWMRFGGVFSGNICGSYAAAGPSNRTGRLPLHLLYRFDEPGAYEVRISVWDRPPGFGPPGTLRARSEWTPIEILPTKPDQRVRWLKSLLEHPPSDPAELMTDTLPSLLGVPDDLSFEILAGHLYHRDATVRRYAMDGLSYWPEDVASARLLGLLRTKGPSDSLLHFLTRQPDFRAAHSGEIVELSLPFLTAESPILLGGAVAALLPASRDNPVLREAMLRSAEHVISRADSQTGSDLAHAIAATKEERAHAILQRLLEKGYTQVATAILSFGDVTDLPRVSALLNDPEGAFFSEKMIRAYGNTAIPYLERALNGTPGRFTAQSITRQLIAVDDPSGFLFAARSIEQKGVSRFDMIQILKIRFPELNGSNDDAVAAFARKRAGTAQ